MTDDELVERFELRRALTDLVRYFRDSGFEPDWWLKELHEANHEWDETEYVRPWSECMYIHCAGPRKMLERASAALGATEAA